MMHKSLYRAMSCAAMLLLATIAWAQTSGDGFIFAPVSSGHAPAGTPPSSHASTLVELKNGDILAAWFGGTRESAPDVKIYGARLHGGNWSAPVELARAKDVACWNPVLFHTSDGRLWLYYKYGKHPDSWLGARKWSDDEGLTWSAEEDLPDGVLGPIKDKPLVLSDGTIVSGSSVEHGKWTVWIERSTDNGRSWTKVGPISVPDSLDVPDAAVKAAFAQPLPKTDGYVRAQITENVGIIQPAIVQMEGNHLRLYARSKSKASRIAIADSFDAGKTWTQARYLALPNPNSGIDATRLKDGRIVLIFNNSYNARTPLNLAVSRDGEHFQVFKTLEDSTGSFAYPAIIGASNGDLLMTYTWNRETIKFVRVPLRDVEVDKHK